MQQKNFCVGILKQILTHSSAVEEQLHYSSKISTVFEIPSFKIYELRWKKKCFLQSNTLMLAVE